MPVRKSKITLEQTINTPRSLYIKYVLFVCVLGLTHHVGLSQNTAIPDPNFEQALINLGLDTAPVDGFVPTANIASVTDLNISGNAITDLTGIADFSNLSVLNCEDNVLTNLDVSSNLLISELYCSNNLLTSLDVSMLQNLKIFWCSYNQLSALDVSQNLGLISLICNDNLLTELNVEPLVDLRVLDFGFNAIASIDLSKNRNLIRLVCRRNNLTDLDVSNAPKLATLYCDDNKLTVLDTSNNDQLNDLSCVFNLLVILDLSNNPALTILNCSNNLLCTLNLKNGNNPNMVVDFGFNISLVCVVVDNVLASPESWTPSNYVGFVSSVDQCKNAIPVDTFGDVVSNKSYTLPNLNNGNYFTASGGTGTALNPGTIITTSQTVYIYNELPCGSNESAFNILIIDDELYIPTFFTPNNDGSHDLWTVSDKDNQVFNILIYDRYGKFLKYLFANDLGWNGTYNGYDLPSDDYWYVINLKSGQSLNGHFTLKR